MWWTLRFELRLEDRQSDGLRVVNGDNVLKLLSGSGELLLKGFDKGGRDAIMEDEDIRV